MENKSATRWWDLPAASLIVVALLTASTRLVATQWTRNLNVVQNLALFGVIAGLALGQSRFSSRLAGFLALIYGAFAVPWQLGLTVERNNLWSDRLSILIQRLTVIIHQLVYQEVVQDSLLFLVLMSILFWFLGTYAGYTLTRYGNAWRAVLPAGLALFVIHSFDAVLTQRAWYLAVYLFFALVLVARVSYLHQKEGWEQSRTALPPHLGLDFIRFTLLAAAIIVLFAWTAPALANSIPVAARVFQRIKQPWDEARDRFDNAFASLRSSVGVVSDYYGSSLLLGRGNKLTDTQAFIVKAPNDVPAGVRFYWRARTYDTYQDGQWISTGGRTVSFNPQNDEILLPAQQGRWTGTFEFYASTAISTMFTPSQPQWVSRPAKADVRMDPDGSADLSSFRADPTVNPGELYKVVATVSNATVSQMRAAGSDYPTWIKEQYLQLPDTITERTILLARNATAGLETPYDKVVAITNYLRQNITYNEVLPSLPSNQDVVDWFLFDSREGFCNYYSSAEIILLRSLGIPSRWAVGYAQGELQDDGTYLVRQKDAHAWPEVYFPELGWVEFEPTASQPALLRLAGDPSSADPNADTQSIDDLEALQRRQLEEELAALREDRLLSPATAQGGGPSTLARILYTAVPLAAGIGILSALLWQLSKRIHLPPFPVVMESSMMRIGMRPPERIKAWSRRSMLPPLAKAYMEINHALSRLGSKSPPAETPTERAGKLIKILPGAEPPAQTLISEYQRATFSHPSQASADLTTVWKAGMEIRKLSYRAMFKKFTGGLFHRFQRPERPIPIQRFTRR